MPLLLLPSIQKLCDSNVGGLRYLRIIPVSAIESIPEAVDHEITSAITLKAGAAIADIFFTEDTGSFTEDPALDRNGKLFRQEVQVQVPKDAPEVADYVNRFTGLKCILQYMDSNGFAKIVGSLEQPLRFEAAQNTGGSFEDLNVYDFVFTGVSYHKAYNYTQFGS